MSGTTLKGRSKKADRHVRFYEFELQTPAYRSLSVGARALLIELRSIYNGSNNGKLFLSVRDAAARLNVGRHAAADGFTDLQDRGFIKPKVEAGFNWKTAARARKATCWVLTDQSTDDAGPTRDFQHWAPKPESKRLPESIRRSPPRDRMALTGDRLALTGDSDLPSGADRGQIRPIRPPKAAQLALRGDTDSYQVEEAESDAGGLRPVGTILRSLALPAVVRAGGAQPQPSLARAATGKRSLKPSSKEASH